MSRYKYVVTDNKVICISSYAGRSVRGIAYCSPNDKFNEEFGRRLARARCDLKVAEKRSARAARKYAEASKQFEEAKDYMIRMHEYRWDADDEVTEASAKLTSLLKSDPNGYVPF